MRLVPTSAGRARVIAIALILASFGWILGCALIPVDQSRSVSFATRRFHPSHPPYSLGEVVFSHEVHDFAECDTCHFGSTGSGSRGGVDLPPMALCFECHEGDTVSDECITCHLENRQGRKPRFHDGQWMRHHARMAEEESYKCRLCHLEDDCSSCHQVRRPASHTPRWMRSAHGRMAVHDRSSCATCHRSDFCENCHSQPPPDHTPIFMTTGHKQAALIRGRACLTCHSFEQTCATCH